MARQVRYYGAVYFLPCLTDFPIAHTPVSIYALNKELIFRYADQTERVFRVTRMRSWRITTIVQVRVIQLRCIFFTGKLTVEFSPGKNHRISTGPNPSWSCRSNIYYPKIACSGLRSTAHRSYSSRYAFRVWSRN